MGRITASHRPLKGDGKYNNPLVTKFINCIMKDGKKSVAERIFYEAMDVVQQRLPGEDPVAVFQTAVENVKPHIEVRSKRVGGAAYQVPMQVNRNRQLSLAIRWILLAVREKKGRPAHLGLADELVAAYSREGAAFTRRQNVHRMADANKAFAHFAW
jgi:small subunit ribosomal protein S7